MNADFLVVLDACVLVQAPLRDTLLRLAEEPRFYLPRWSDEIIAEMVRTLQSQFGLASEKTTHLVDELKKHFGDAWVTNYEPFVSHMTNHPNDRHVLASAVRCGAQVIVTYNKRHFPMRSGTMGNRSPRSKHISEVSIRPESGRANRQTPGAGPEHRSIDGRAIESSPKGNSGLC